MTITYRQRMLSGHEDGVVALSDLDLVQRDGGTYLLATSLNGRVTSYAIDAGGDLSFLNHRTVGMDDRAGTGIAGTVLTDGPSPRLLVGGRGHTGAATLEVKADGGLRPAVSVAAAGASASDFSVAVQLGGGQVVARSADGMGITLSATGAGLDRAPVIDVEDRWNFHARGVTDLVAIRMGDRDVIVAAAQGDGSGQLHAGISTWTSDGTDLRRGGSIGTLDGIGFMVPTAIDVATVAGQTYLVLASAQDASGGLSVLRVKADGGLTPVDHVNDTLDTRFGGAQAVATAMIGDRVYVVAGGTDMGISLFVLTPDGQLVLLDSFADTLAAGLADITALSLRAQDGTLHIYATSEQEAGITHLTYTPDGTGRTIVVDGGGGLARGTGAPDLLVGGRGDDTLDGGGHGDIILDGAGADVMTGGWGLDTFVLSADGAVDRITDFNPGQDRLDLGSWPFLYDMRSLSIVSTADGARIEWRGETLILTSNSGTPLSAEQVRAAIVAGPNRTFRILDMTLEGGGADDALTGSWGADLLVGRGGADTLDGGDGDDRLFGGGDDDELRGGDGGDLLNGGAGHDRLYGNDGDDVMFGGAEDDGLWGAHGDDRLHGEAGADGLWGGRGADTLDGGDGDDRLFGGGDTDLLLGGAGADHLDGEADADILDGGAGNDTLHGGDGDDRLEGGDGDDVLWGDDGDDWLSGDDGADRLYGREGDDTLSGGRGDDVLWGSHGDDVLNGNGGADRLLSGSGADTLNGGSGADELLGGSGDDSLLGGADADLLIGETGDDTLRGGGGPDFLSGRQDDDLLNGGGGADTLYGGGGDDILQGGRGDDRLSGGPGANRLFGQAGNDRLIGGDDGDLLNGGGGNDLLEGGGGPDTLVGGAGADTFVFDVGAGRNVIQDFSIHEDRLVLDVDLLLRPFGPPGVLYHHADVTDDGVLFDFGNGDTILLQGLDSLDGLRGAIDIL